MSSSHVARGSRTPLRVIAATALLVSVFVCSGAMAPRHAWACACGCGVFEVGTASMFPSGAGGTVWLEYDYQDQSHNWSGSSPAPKDQNGDKNLTTNFFTAGMQYMFNRSWGVQAEIPYWDRSFRTDVNFPSPPPDIEPAHWSDLGDIRLKGIYTGFSDDLSTGITFGVKLPTGNYQFDPAVVDRDSEIGSGSTDLLLGAFHRGTLTQDNMWGWYAQTQLDQPVFTQQRYRPGTEIDTAFGAYYNGWSFGNLTIVPIGTAVVSIRTRDSGANAAQPLASGFQRLLLAPGVELDFPWVSFNLNARIPVYQHFTGDQLAAPVLVQLVASVNF